MVRKGVEKYRENHPDHAMVGEEAFYDDDD
jgi:uncharacterized short protein YbdD (DUF466 family)